MTSYFRALVISGCGCLLAAWAPVIGQTSRPATVPAGDGPSAQPHADSKSQRKPFNLLTTDRLTGDWCGARTALEDAGVAVELEYLQQFQQNFRGGLRTHNGHRFSGSYDLALDVDFEKLKLIPGGSFYIKARGNYSDGINPDKVGALYNVNADAFRDEPIFIRKWWYKQELFDGKLEFRLGRIQTHKDLFDVSLYANHEDKDFLNRMVNRSGIIPNVNSLGAFAKVAPVKWFYAQAAVLDSQAEIRTKTGFDTAFHDEDWFYAFYEVGLTPAWKTGRGPMPGRYRFGGWYDPNPREIYEYRTEDQSVRMRRGGTGLYLGLDQMVYKENADPKDTQGLGLFSRLGCADGEVNRVDFYWSSGLSYKGLIPTRNKDVFGFAVADAALSDEYRRYVKPKADHETVFEWYYSYFLTPWCIISPDFQVIVNPGGKTTDRDAIVGGIRMRIIF